MRGACIAVLATFGFDSTALAQFLIAAPPRVPVAPATATASAVPHPQPGQVPPPQPRRSAAARTAVGPETTTTALASTNPSDPTTTAAHTYPAGWSLVSVPLLPANPAASAVFDEVKAPLRLYDYVDGQVVPSGEAGFRNVAPGRAFWMVLAASVTVRASGQPVASSAEYRVAIKPGWNAIATPWFSAIDWTDGQVSVRNGTSTVALSSAMAQGWIEGTLDDPGSSGGYGTIAANSAPAGQLRPWRGYLLYSQVTGELVFAPPPPDTTPPSVSLISPADGAELTQPTEVVGTATDTNLMEWRLEYSPTEGGTPVVLGHGDVPVEGTVLGTLDPTLLLNGTYDVRLVATDAVGSVSTLTHSVVVRDNMKVGNFTVSFVDLEVPVAGLPIRVIRTYDSRDKRRGDFGVGWRVELTNLRLTRNLAAGANWQGTSTGFFFPTYCLEPTRSHLVTVTLPSGKVYEFDAVTSPQCQQFVPIQGATVTYKARPGTVATLAPVGSSDVLVSGNWPGPMQLVDYSTAEPFDPQRYQLTLPDGRAFVIDRQQGLQTITDLNGNQLTVGPGGVTHSSGTGVAFARDGLGRITAITDPAGNAMTYGYDANGDLENYTDREANVTHYTYNATHGLLSILDPRGVQPIRNEYDDSGRLIRHTDAFGKTIEYTHDVSGRQETVTDRLGQARVLEYDERGNVVREVDPQGRVVQRTFDALNNRTSETNGAGNTATYAYDDQNNVVSSRDAAGNETRFTYNNRRQVATITDAKGLVTGNSYDPSGNLLSITDAAGKVTSFTYDGRGNPLTMTDGGGCVTRYQYDASGNVVQETSALGHVATYTYDANGKRLIQVTSEGGQTRTTAYSYDKLGRLVQTAFPDGSVTAAVYDGVGQKTKAIDQLGHETTYAYDDMNRLTVATYADGTQEQSTYDGEGHPLTRTDRGGRTTQYEYDALGRLTKTTSPDGAAASNEYDAAGRLTAAKDARGNVTAYEYDAVGRPVRVVDAAGGATTYTYDGDSNLVSVTDARGLKTSYEYDVLNHRTRTVFPDATDQKAGFDALGRLLSRTDQAGRTTRFTYDCEGRLSEVTNALNQATRYAYDQQGNLVSQTDAAGHTTTFTHDALGRELTRTVPSGRVENRAYDARGNLIKRTDFNGVVVNYTYDAVDRLVGRSYSDGSTVAFTYTPGGRRATAVDSRGTTSYAYDARDRLTSLAYPDGTTLEYGYDPQGNRTRLTAKARGVPLTTTYSYDKLNRLLDVTDPQGRAYHHGYDPDGNRTSLSYPNGLATAYTYDNLDRLSRLSTTQGAALVQSYGYTLDPAGNRTRVDENDGSVRSYGYDALYRVVQETVSGAVNYQKNFTYDAAGNRATQTDSRTAPVVYGYDERDRLLTQTGIVYSWDENGALVGKSGADGASYEWNLDNRLKRVTRADGTVITHTYDADGNRVRAEIRPPGGAPQVTNYVVDPGARPAQVALETDAAGNAGTYYVRGDDLLAAVRPGATRFYHADGLGSVRVLTDEGGTPTDRYAYSAFGEAVAGSGSDPNPYRFAGEALDTSGGLYYHRARWMDTGVGRFVSPDPYPPVIEEPSTLHRYLYVGSNPVNRTDPSGLLPSWLEYALIGMQAHKVIEVQYAALGATIDTAINEDVKQRPDIRFHQDARLFLFGASVPGTAGEIYEIKPAARYDLGADQVQKYVGLLTTAYPGVTWRPGAAIQPVPSWPGVLVHPLVFNKRMYVSLMGEGVIGYRFDDDFTGGEVIVLMAILNAASLLIQAAMEAELAEVRTDLAVATSTGGWY